VSADNCIAIARFTNMNKFVYRVIHAQAIENCELSGWNFLCNPKHAEECVTASRVLYYRDSKTYTTYEQAYEAATKFYNHYPYVEYGIRVFYYDVPFPTMTVEEAEHILNGDHPTIYDGARFDAKAALKAAGIDTEPKVVTRTCRACGVELTPVYGTVEEASDNNQFSDAMEIKLGLGYGMYTDPYDKSAQDLIAVICKDCVEYLRDMVPWIDEMLINLEN
jgi:hypothetical protein